MFLLIACFRLTTCARVCVDTAPAAAPRCLAASASSFGSPAVEASAFPARVLTVPTAFFIGSGVILEAAAAAPFAVAIAALLAPAKSVNSPFGPYLTTAAAKISGVPTELRAYAS